MPNSADTHLVSSSVDSSTGAVTIKLAGTWAWPTHRSDCNKDKRAVGVAIDWNDVNDPGYPLTLKVQPKPKPPAPKTVTVGVGATGSGASPQDNTAHPAEPGTDSPNLNQWQGGCGTFNPSLGYNTGTWGPLTHTYAAGAVPDSVCVVTYDVHLKTNTVGPPTGLKQITAGGPDHNGDNSIEGNGPQNACFNFTIPGPATVSLGYADSVRPGGHGLPQPWKGSANVIFAGCNSPDATGVQAAACPQPNGSDAFDAGAIMIDNTSGNTPLTVTSASVDGGSPCNVTWNPWPGLNVTVPAGKILILTQTSLSGDPCGQNLGGNYNFDLSESNGNSNCVPTGAHMTVHLTINGSPVSILDTNQILNTGGVDGGACNGGKDEFHDWVVVKTL